MGLLDDAIREHLELKRRRGADPEEVAREQREALDAGAARNVATVAAEAADPQVTARADPAVGSPDLDDSDSPADPGDGKPTAQSPNAVGADETAELDMSSVLGEDVETEDPSVLPRDTEAQAGGARPAPTPPTPDEDSLEWEVPGEASEEEPDKLQEDVLEETPDFLRDTPEQDRLWFEQRPPRDFDFDK